MAGIADLITLGYLPLQGRPDLVERDLALRPAVYGVRQRDLDTDPESPDFGRERVDDGSAGDLLGGFLLRAEDGPEPNETELDKKNRDLNAWLFACAANLTQPLKRTDKIDERHTRTDEDEDDDRGNARGRPVRQGRLDDDRFSEFAAEAGDLGLPKGWPVVVLAGTHEGKQRLVMVPGGGKLVAVEHAGDPATATYVFDENDDAEVDRKRAARLHSLVRPTAPEDGGHAPMDQDRHVIAVQHKGGGKDGDAGFGLIAGPLGESTASAGDQQGPYAPKDGEAFGGITNTDLGHTEIGNDPEVRRQQVREGRYSSVEDPTGPPNPHQGSVEDPKAGGGLKSAEGGSATGIGFLPHSHGGPVLIGIDKDKHHIGANADGEQFYSAHVPTGALYLLDQAHDAPLEFQSVPYKAMRGPLTVRTHLRYDAGMGHPWAFGGKDGMWRWLSEAIAAEIEPPPETGGFAAPGEGEAYIDPRHVGAGRDGPDPLGGGPGAGPGSGGPGSGGPGGPRDGGADDREEKCNEGPYRKKTPVPGGGFLSMEYAHAEVRVSAGSWDGHNAAASQGNVVEKGKCAKTPEKQKPLWDPGSWQSIVAIEDGAGQVYQTPGGAEAVPYPGNYLAQQTPGWSEPELANAETEGAPFSWPTDLVRSAPALPQESQTYTPAPSTGPSAEQIAQQDTPHQIRTRVDPYQRSVAGAPVELGAPAILGWSGHHVAGAHDVATDFSPFRVDQERHQATAPMVYRQESVAAEQGREFVYAERPGASAYTGGTAEGFALFGPPQQAVVDLAGLTRQQIVDLVAAGRLSVPQLALHQAAELVLGGHVPDVPSGRVYGGWRVRSAGVAGDLDVTPEGATGSPEGGRAIVTRSNLNVVDAEDEADGLFVDPQNKTTAPATLADATRIEALEVVIDGNCYKLLGEPC